jgi:VanZ family protein
MTAQRKILPSVSAASVALGLATAIVVLSVVPPTLRLETGLPHGIEHFVIYWGTGLAFALGYELKPALLATRLVFFSGAVEIAQLFVPGRHARLSDFIVDASAITVGVMAVSKLVTQGSARSNAKSPLPAALVDRGRQGTFRACDED